MSGYVVCFLLGVPVGTLVAFVVQVLMNARRAGLNDPLCYSLEVQCLNCAHRSKLEIDRGIARDDWRGECPHCLVTARIEQLYSSLYLTHVKERRAV